MQTGFSGIERKKETFLYKSFEEIPQRNPAKSVRWHHPHTSHHRLHNYALIAQSVLTCFRLKSEFLHYKQNIRIKHLTSTNDGYYEWR